MSKSGVLYLFFKHAGEEFYTYVPCKHDNFLVRCFKPLSYSYIKERIIINSFKLIKHGKKHGIVDTICNFWGYTGTTSFTMNNLAIPHLSWNAESLPERSTYGCIVWVGMTHSKHIYYIRIGVFLIIFVLYDFCKVLSMLCIQLLWSQFSSKLNSLDEVRKEMNLMWHFLLICHVWWLMLCTLLVFHKTAFLPGADTLMNPSFSHFYLLLIITFVGESPSSSASDIDNLNNNGLSKGSSSKDANSPQVAGNHLLLAARNQPHLMRLLAYVSC